MGGYVAYEIAQQMLTQNEEVPLIILFDVHGPAFKRTENIALFHMRKFFDLQPENRLKYAQARIAGLQKRFSRRSFQVAHTISRNLNVSLPGRFRDVRQTHLLARHTYKPKPFAGKGVIFQAEDQPEGFDEYLKGWDGLFGNGLEICITPGSHKTMMHEPNIQKVAKTLIHVLEKIDINMKMESRV